MHTYQPEVAPTDALPLDLDIGVIYTYERHYMTPLVTTLAASGNGLAMRLIVVDNASTDGVADWTSQFEHTRLIANHKRLGYAPNLNRILSVASARYVLLLNTDMVFEPSEQCLAKMVRFMDLHPACGLGVCRLYHPNGTYGYPARRFPSWQSIASRRLGLGRWLPKSIDDHLYVERPESSTFVCDWASGCFIFLRREAIATVGGFDEGYVKYFEDVDLCLRMKLAGWDVMINGDTYCYHYEQRKSKNLFSRDAWWHGRAYARWLLKWGVSGRKRLRVAAMQPMTRLMAPDFADYTDHRPRRAA